MKIAAILTVFNRKQKTNVFQELLAADEYGYQQTGRYGLSSEKSI